MLNRSVGETVSSSSPPFTVASVLKIELPRFWNANAWKFV
jgi:hypothetical protein